MRLKDKVALITGAGSGIGRQSALLFAKEGASVLAVDLNEQAAAETVGMLRQAGGRAVAFRADVSKARDCQQMVAAAEREFGRLNVLFNNAGIMHAKDDDAIGTDESVWDLTLDVNAKGVFLGCLRVHVHGEDRRALPREEQRRLASDAAACARDERHFVLESHMRSKYLLRSQSVTALSNAAASVR